MPSTAGGGVWTGAYAAPIDQAVAPAGGSMSDETLREEISLSVPGSGYVRLHLSNAHSNAPVAFDSVTLAAQSSGLATVAAPGAVDFANSPSVNIPAGGDVYSDPVKVPSTATGSGRLTVSMHVAATSTVTQVPIHDSLTAYTNYASGNVADNQDGSTESGFYLGYLNSSGGEWAMYFMAADTTNPAWQPQIRVGGVTANTWTHLVGTYDASTQTAQLFVNGVLAGTATGITTWNATGAFTVGRDLYNGGQADYLDGEITDVRTWTSKLPTTQAIAVYTDSGASTLTTANALAAFNQSASQEPNIHDVVLGVGENDVLDGTSVSAMKSSIAALVNGIAGQYTNNAAGRTIQVFVDTVPPLGLPSTDAREQNRQQINSWITSTYTGGQGIDIATAVADPSNINQIASTYLTGGVPNSSYYNQIAQAVATTIGNAFPPISLARHRS